MGLKGRRNLASLTRRLEQRTERLAAECQAARENGDAVATYRALLTDLGVPPPDPPPRDARDWYDAVMNALRAPSDAADAADAPIPHERSER